MSGEPVRSCVTATGASWSRFNSYSGMHRSRPRYLGCKQNLGHPVNDLFDLRTAEPSDEENNTECVRGKGTTPPVEMASRQGIECRHGGSEHDQPVCDARPLSLPKRTDLVEVRKGPRPHSLRRCPGARASRGDSGSKEDGQPDPAAVGSVGLGTLPDPTS